MSALSESIAKCRRAGVPLVGVDTLDPAGVVRSVCPAVDELGAAPVVQWDVIRGAVGANESGADWVNSICAGQDPAIVTGNPSEFLGLLGSLPADGVAVLLGWARVFDSPEPLPMIQGVWNLRDVLKISGACVVMVGGVSWSLPGELRNDVVMLSDPLPDDAALGAMASSLLDDAGLGVPAPDVLGAAVSALSGLSTFGAEQSLALSLSKEGIDLNGLWERKRKLIEQTPGLSVWRGGGSLDDLGGLEEAKGFYRRPWADDMRPRCVLFLDELEKVLGSSGDTSGVSQGFLGTLLEWFQDNAVTGSILLGHPGSGKSALAKSLGSMWGVPTIKLDLGAMRGSLVGQSEERLRGALQVVDAIGRGRVVCLATSNGVESVPPEMRSRFTLPWFFFDLPSGDERGTIWDIYKAKHGRDPAEAIPPCEGWVGREIESCVVNAERLDIPLVESAAYVVPLCTSAPESIDSLRRYASGRFLSASAPGVFRHSAAGAPGAAPGRKVVV